ncbi:MAG: DUF6683 family protein [Chitinophagales bacterium]
MNIFKVNHLAAFTFSLLLGMTCFSFSAKAQYGGSNSFTNLVIRHNIERSMLSNRVFNNMRANDMLRKDGSTINSTAPKATPKPISVFEASTQRIVTKEVQDQTTKELYEHVLCNYENVAHKDGFIPNDMAYALNYYLIHNYIIYHNLYYQPEVNPNDPMAVVWEMARQQQTQLDVAYERSIHRQFQQFIEGNDHFKNMTNAQKQEVAESLAVTTGMLWMLYADYLKTKDTSAYPEIQKTAYNNLKMLLGENADVDKLKVGYTGMSFE